MGFSTKRGRPKKTNQNDKPEIDLGTKELQQKRERNLTAEPIDICRHKGIIDDEQHAAALHFRWLYTLKFGAAGVSAMDLSGLNGRNIKNTDEEWQCERELEYSYAIEKLRKISALKMVMNVAIFNYHPEFLRKKTITDLQQIKQNTIDLAKLREGLTILSNQRLKPAYKQNNQIS